MIVPIIKVLFGTKTLLPLKKAWAVLGSNQRPLQCQLIGLESVVCQSCLAQPELPGEALMRSVIMLRTNPLVPLALAQAFGRSLSEVA